MPLNPYNKTPEKPTKVIFDKNDPHGAMLPVLFPGISNYNYNIFRDGKLFIGCDIGSFSDQKRELGTMEYVNPDKYRITCPVPPIKPLQLSLRNITVTSGGLPLKTEKLFFANNKNNFELPKQYVFVYANRKDAIGAFDDSVLPLP